MAQYLGIPLIGPIAGVLVDKWDKRWTLLACDLIRLVAVLIIPLAYWGNFLSTPLLFACVAVISGATIFFTIGTLVAVPAFVSDHDSLVRGYSRLEGTRSVTEVGGPSLAAALYSAMAWRRYSSTRPAMWSRRVLQAHEAVGSQHNPRGFGLATVHGRIPLELGRSCVAPSRDRRDGPQLRRPDFRDRAADPGLPRPRACRWACWALRCHSVPPAQWSARWSLRRSASVRRPAARWRTRLLSHNWWASACFSRRRCRPAWSSP
jgi:hypothetical protein